jgi:TolA-binding protein
VIEKALKVPGGDGTADPNSPELAAADKLRDQKKYAEAFDAYEALIRKHRTDDVGKAAKRHLDEMKKLPDVQELVKQRQATAESDRWLKFARQQRDAKQYDMARKYYQKIIDAYPGTDGAKTAEAELKALPAAQ